MTGRDDHAVSRRLGIGPVGPDNGMGNNGGRRGHILITGNAGFNPSGRQDLYGDFLGRTGQGMGVFAQKERAGVALFGAKVADRLGNRQDMTLGKTGIER